MENLREMIKENILKVIFAILVAHFIGKKAFET